MSVIDVLFPKVRSELVRLLFVDPGKQFHLRELARLSNLSVGTLQAEVRKLSHAGLLTARPDGNRLYYRANTAHPVFPELHGLAEKTTGLRQQLAEALDGLPGIEFAFAFGSQASGTAKEESDIDLFIIGSVGLRALAPRGGALPNLSQEPEDLPHDVSVRGLTEGPNTSSGPYLAPRWLRPGC